MFFITLSGCAIVLVLALDTDPNGTLRMVIAIITVRGVTWVVKKITETINKEASQLIDFTGWSIAGISCVGIIKNALKGVKDILDWLDKINLGLKKIEDKVEGFDKDIENFMGRIFFWN